MLATDLPPYQPQGSPGTDRDHLIGVGDAVQRHLTAAGTKALKPTLAWTGSLDGQVTSLVRTGLPGVPGTLGIEVRGRAESATVTKLRWLPEGQAGVALIGDGATQHLYVPPPVTRLTVDGAPVPFAGGVTGPLHLTPCQLHAIAVDGPPYGLLTLSRFFVSSPSAGQAQIVTTRYLGAGQEVRPPLASIDFCREGSWPVPVGPVGNLSIPMGHAGIVVDKSLTVAALGDVRVTTMVWTNHVTDQLGPLIAEVTIDGLSPVLSQADPSAAQSWASNSGGQLLPIALAGKQYVIFARVVGQGSVYEVADVDVLTPIDDDVVVMIASGPNPKVTLTSDKGLVTRDLPG